MEYFVSRRRFAFACSHIIRAFTSVLFGSNLNRCFSLRTGGIKELLQKRHAPAATRACTSAFTDLAGDSRLMNANEIHNLPLRNMKAIAELVVRLHLNGQGNTDA